MDFRDLEYIVRAAEELNLSRAADKLIVSQPTLSKTLARLEEAAGAPLFLRNRHGLELTAAGRRFVGIAHKLLRIKRDLDDEMRVIAQGQAGRIQLGISHTFSRSLVPKVLPVYSRLHPDVEVVIHTHTSSLLENLLVQDAIDVAVLVETGRNSSLAYEHLFQEEVLLAVAKDGKLAAKAAKRKGRAFPFIAPAELAGERFILSQAGMRLRESADAFFRAEGIIPDIAVTTASNMTALRLASHGVGVAFIPASYARLSLEPPLPRFFSTSASLPDWNVAVVMRKKSVASPLLAGFAAAFKDACA